MAKQNPRLSRTGRERKDLIEREGCEVLGWTLSKSNHYKFRVRLPEGIERTIFTPFSGGSRGGDRNMIEDIRKLRAAA